MKTVLLLKQKLLQYGFDPPHTLHSKHLKMLLHLGQFCFSLKFDHTNIVDFLYYYNFNVLHIRQKIRGFQLGNLLIYKEQLAFTVQAVF